ncbi:MAG: bifunctional oligoribonuclease/PAP phosphatase NrnA [Treponema sp.]|jgi:phosphoesterase RecJ-like protein|nr:bifunctional oligoribonuclease/PAP phosphatase NrnA [Treponema sp.]
MSIPVPQELLDFIRKHKKFIITGHKEPDGDCVGSQLAMASVLKRLGKEVVVCSAGPFRRGEISAYQDRFADAVRDEDRLGAAVVIMDCSTVNRTGDLKERIEGLPTAIVDHHEGGNHRASSQENPVFIDPSAPSVTFLILALIESLGLAPTEEEAKLLFLGLCTDTGFFRHVDSTGYETFAYASRLIKAGANPKETFRFINGGKSFASRRFLGVLLAGSRQYFDGKLILATEEYHESRRFGLENRDSDTLYRLLQTVDGVEVAMFIRQETPVSCSVGLRSLDKIDVSAIAAAFGGGGHKNAAGVTLKGTIRTIRPQFLDVFEKIFRRGRDA